jgi:hypothetical protein
MEQVHIMMFVCGSEYGLKIMHFLKALLFHRSTHIHFHFVADKDARPVLKQECVPMTARLQDMIASDPTCIVRWQKLRQLGGVGSGVPFHWHFCNSVFKTASSARPHSFRCSNSFACVKRSR